MFINTTVYTYICRLVRVWMTFDSIDNSRKNTFRQYTGCVCWGITKQKEEARFRVPTNICVCVCFDVEGARGWCNICLPLLGLRCVLVIVWCNVSSSFAFGWQHKYFLLFLFDAAKCDRVEEISLSMCNKYCIVHSTLNPCCGITHTSIVSKNIHM